VPHADVRTDDYSRKVLVARFLFWRQSESHGEQLGVNSLYPADRVLDAGVTRAVCGVVLLAPQQGASGRRAARSGTGG